MHASVESLLENIHKRMQNVTYISPISTRTCIKTVAKQKGFCYACKTISGTKRNSVYNYIFKRFFVEHFLKGTSGLMKNEGKRLVKKIWLQTTRSITISSNIWPQNMCRKIFTALDESDNISSSSIMGCVGLSYLFKVDDW